LHLLAGTQGALQASAEEGREAGASYQVPEGAGQAVPGLPHQRAQEGMQGVPQDRLHSGRRRLVLAFTLGIVAEVLAVSQYFIAEICFTFPSNQDISLCTIYKTIYLSILTIFSVKSEGR
jgi:hypothetical protein